jgi:hypothetical protein
MPALSEPGLVRVEACYRELVVVVVAGLIEAR